MKSIEWMQSVGKATVGVGIVAAPAGAVLAVVDATPAAAWTVGHCYNYYNSEIYAYQSTCVSRSGSIGASHPYRGLMKNKSGGDTGHLEVAVYASGWHTYNHTEGYVAPYATQSLVTPNYKNAHSEKIWWWHHTWSQFGQISYYNSWGYFNQTGF